MKFLFFGAVKNEWSLLENCIKSARRVFFPFDCRFLIIDDGSEENELKKAWELQKRVSHFSYLSNSGKKGIIYSLNKCINTFQKNNNENTICIPVSADSFFINPKYPFLLFWAFQICKADFFFAKTVHKTVKNKITGITGWSAKKGIQCSANTKENFLNGKCRPSGWAVAFRKNILKRYNYPNVGSLSDYYLNNLMILKHKSFYSSQKVVSTLERDNSFSASFSKKDNKINLLRCIKLFKSQGIYINRDEVKKLLLAEGLS